MSTKPLQLVLQIEYMRQVNWSLICAGLPLVKLLSVENRGPTPTEPLTVRVSLSGFLDTGPLPVPSLAPRTTHKLAPPLLPWVERHFEAAMLIRNPREVPLTIEVGPYTGTLPIELAMPDEWYFGIRQEEHRKRFWPDDTITWAAATIDFPPGGTVSPFLIDEPWDGEPPLQVATAALVQPEHPRVIELKHHAIVPLQHITHNPNASLDDCVSGSAADRSAVVEAVFTALAERYPRVFHDVEPLSLNARSQRVRLPHAALPEDPEARHGATCVDFALLMAGVLHACGLRPLFVLIGTDWQKCHALVACWLDDGTVAEPLISRAKDMRAYVKYHQMLAVDVTEFSRGQHNFGAACRKAGALIKRKSFCYAVDVQAAYDKYRFQPLPHVGAPPAASETNLSPTAAGEPAASSARTSVSDLRAERPAPSLLDRFQEWLAATLFARRYTQRYLRNLVAEHEEFSFLEGAKRLRLDRVYVSLRVGEHVPRA